MKVIVKNLQKQNFEVEIPENATIGDVKVALEAQHKLEAPSQQKLILKGKVLADDNQKIEDLKLAPTDFFVVMISKAKPVESDPKPMEVEKPVPQQQQPPQTPTQQPQTSTQPQTTTQTQEPQTEQADVGGASALVTGSALEKTIAQLMEISGQPKEIVQRALRAAYNNPDRAVEYLFNGIPSNAEEAVAPQPTAPQAQTQVPQTQVPQTQVPQAQTQSPQQTPFFQQPAPQQHQQQQGGPSPLEALRALPEFPQIRNMVRTNPQLLQPLLVQLNRTNPQLVQYIQQHPEEFFQLLSDEDEEGGALPPNVIQVTPEEKEAIERLEKLGFERSKVIEAFFACDKNETLAANYLFDHMNEED